MKILVIGEERQFDECRAKLGSHEFSYKSHAQEAIQIIPGHDVVFDFSMNNSLAALRLFANHPLPVFINTCKTSLAELLSQMTGKIRCAIFGFNGLPTQFNRRFLEVSLLKHEHEAALAKICSHLQTEYLLVDDRVGLVSPRVICMIINEAYFTVQEGTASREDIDLAMKLGTNYPYGPFEWCARIGLKHVYEVIEAIYQDTKDERYRISGLMKKEYLSGEW